MFIGFEREGGREKERKKKIKVREKYLLYVPWLGIEPTTFWGTGQHSNQLNHLARAENLLLIYHIHNPSFTGIFDK